jgi:NhaP-type Na+/H+ or K+/H+ antiporter
VLFFDTARWSWNAALTTGAILAATDPVAVVALMKELGVSERLATLLEGESLLNDGTAIVVFQVAGSGCVATCRPSLLQRRMLLVYLRNVTAPPPPLSFFFLFFFPCYPRFNQW